MTDTQLLEDKIKSSGLKIGYIVDKLGISRQAWDKKKKNEIPFRAAEVYVLCDLLNISDEDKPKFFCRKG